MKLWQKIYLFSILPFIIIFTLASVLIIERNHSKLLQQEIDTTLRENMSIRSTMEAIVPFLKIYRSPDYEQTVWTTIGNEFVAKNSDHTMYLNIIEEPNRVAYSNIDFAIPQKWEELQSPAKDEILSILSDVGERTILFTSSLVDLNDRKYSIRYMKDVTAVYEERVEQYQFFMKVDIIACLLYLILMIFISKGLTRPIERMVRTAKVIAQGDISKRVDVNTKDEIGNLAENFNRMVQVVEDKINELELNNLEKQRFIHDFTHELKTPLTSIIGYANFLRVTKYQEDVFVDGLNVIHDEAKRLESLSLKMMDLILIREDHFELSMENLKAVLDEAEPVLTMKAKERQIQIAIDANDCWMEMDKDLMKMLIYNLVDNAIKASAEQDTITIKVYGEEQRCVLVVADQGIGIAPEHLDKIFEPFYVSDKARSRRYNGVGLGLSICQSVARMHHGTFEVASEENVGTTIKVIFETGKRNEVKQ
ncbi:two-component sensor histidine kinase [Paenibacillus montaniterrae]|uniref:histidine kinase n=1 Tax=Paenibacillus montaniterrae TaxID=429341 RepID=A0A919YNA9_9BACL|nr:HAMP domain-containing sensor histidine kinase [Paenibacillus montaniterrae]GIP17627.1 two-component sensor histidine kinase [Paenibacillus montaniterrae]